MKAKRPRHTNTKDIFGPYGACHAKSGYGYLAGDRWCVGYKSCKNNWLPPTVTRDEADAVIGLMQKAYDAGYEDAKRQVRQALGLEAAP